MDASPSTVVSRFASLTDALGQSFRRHGNAPAFSTLAATYSYDDLWKMSERVAGGLDDLALPAEAPVAMHAPSTIEAYTVMLGVLRSGRAYLPLNPSLPGAAMNRMVQDAGACCILSAPDLGLLVAGRSVSPLVDQGAKRTPDDDHVAAIVYTSASSGSQKGVALTDRSILFHAFTYGAKLDVTDRDCVSLFPALFAGVSISNVFGAWLAGACLRRMSLADEGLEGMLAAIEREVTVLHLVPTVFRRLTESRSASRAFRQVRCVKLGGESVTGLDARCFAEVADPSARLLNGLGITEAGGNVTFGEVPRDLPPAELAPVGVPVEGIEAAVIPSNGSPDHGELVVRSSFLAAGYVDASSASVFRTHDDGTRSLRTGDQVRRADDGTWVHLGRTDQVVQVNGVRVSLPEVEAALRDAPGIDEACVFLEAPQTGRARLLAAVAASGSVPVSAVRQHLGGRLETTKMPHLFYRFPVFPTLPGGKVDRVRLLADVQETVPLRDTVPDSPSDRHEVELLAAWRRVLRRPDVGVSDSVFDFGGDSLTAVELLSRLDRAGLTVTTEELYQHPTVERLAAHLKTRDEGCTERASPVVLLKQGTTGQQVVIIPGGGSGVLSLLELAKSLPDDITVYGLHYPGIDDDEPYRMSVSELAVYFMRHIDERLPGQSFALAGTSFGGMVAFEMARRYELAGTPLPFIGLIDTYGPNALTLRPGLSLTARVEACKRWLLPVGFKHAWTAGNIVSGVRQKLRLAVAGLWLRGSRRRPRPYERRFLYLMKASFMASRRYRIHPVRSKIHFFSVDEQLPELLYARDETLGWGEASRAGVEVIRTPGRHGTHIRPPHVDTLGEKLGRVVKEALCSRRPESAIPAASVTGRPLLSVVIPTWNAFELTQQAIDHLHKGGQTSEVELVVVNDGSDDDTSTALRARYRDVVVIDHHENRGFGAAVNTGFMAAHGRYVATVNNDASVSIPTLMRLCQFLEASPRAAAAAPQLLDAAGKWLRVGHMRPARSLERMFGRRGPWGVAKGLSTRQEAPYRADWLQGACVVFNRAALEEVGLFDEQFHLFAEEIDLFHRLSREGWEAWVVPDVTAMHVQGQTTRNHHDPGVSARCRVQSYRSICIYYDKHFARPASMLLRGALAARLSGRLVRSLGSPSGGWGCPRGPGEHLRYLSVVLGSCVSKPSEPSLSALPSADPSSVPPRSVV